MKTAISIPDATFERATERALALGMSRSEFFAVAATRYLDDLEAESVTEQINLALANVGAEDDSASDAVAVGRRVAALDADEW